MAIQFRRGAPAPNYVLLDGEPGWDSQNKIFKVGDGVTPWSELPESSQEAYDSVKESLLDGLILRRVTQAEYDALPTPRPDDVLYVITES